MLIKFKNGTWHDMSNVVGLRAALCKGMSRCYYTILVSMKNGEEFGYKECSDYEEAEKAMDELAKKINAAQGGNPGFMVSQAAAIHIEREKKE